MILPLKKHHYGTVIVNLDTGKIIDILDTRDPDEIQKALSEYPNLHTISRDRGYSYKVVSKECDHIADRFHLIMNLSEAISKEIKSKIPMYINITKERNEIISIDSKDVKIEYTDKQKEKQKLILEIKKESAKGKSDRSIAKEYGIDRRTVAKYINVTDVEGSSVYNTSNRNYSYLDSYKDEITKLYSLNQNASEVYRILKGREISLTYSNLKHYISKIKDSDMIKGNNGIKCQGIEKISRSQVIKYIFNWKYNEEITIYIDEILEIYPLLKLYKMFYQRFREYLINLNTLCFVNLINSKYEDSCINKFIAPLKTDLEAVINAASYGISNGITEGSVNKIKQIKRDMYGRASYELLRKKVIYQSLFS